MNKANTTAAVKTETNIVIKSDQFFFRSVTIRERLKHRVKRHPLLLAIVDANGNLEGITCDCCTDCCHPIGEHGIMDHRKRTVVHHSTESFRQFMKKERARKKIHSSEKNYTSKVTEEPLEHKNAKEK